MLSFETGFAEVAMLLAVVTIIAAIGRFFRQPLIVAFIAAGILVGPSALSLVESTEQIELLAQMGIALLLFVVGLKLDLHIIRTMGPVALATGLGQVVFTSIFGYLIARLLGLSPVSAIYVGVALTFSSTIIIVKLFDKKEIDALHGRIAVGFLIVQDIVVVLVMIGLTAMGAGNDAAPDQLLTTMLWVVAKGFALLAGIALLIKFILPVVSRQMAQSAELLILFAVSWAVTLATVGELMGFSKEVGAFLAGVSLASTPYREVIGARLVSLRDFLLLFFFIELGSGLDVTALTGQLAPALVLSAFVLIGNPLIVMAIMGFMGYRKRTGFLAGLTVAQISEFSLILAALGLSLGHLDRNIVGLITISGSTYLILYPHPLYQRLAPLLSVFERKHPDREDAFNNGDNDGHPKIVILGLGRFGMAIAESLHKSGQRVLGIDTDPEVIRTRAGHDINVRFGDAEDPEFLDTLPLNSVSWIVCTARERDISLSLLKTLHDSGYRGKTAVTASTASDALALEQAGADRVLRPFLDAAQQAADRLLADISLSSSAGQIKQ